LICKAVVVDLPPKHVHHVRFECVLLCAAFFSSSWRRERLNKQCSESEENGTDNSRYLCTVSGCATSVYCCFQNTCSSLQKVQESSASLHAFIVPWYIYWLPCSCCNLQNLLSLWVDVLTELSATCELLIITITSNINHMIAIRVPNSKHFYFWKYRLPHPSNLLSTSS
jgi:hypothetical protein